MRNLLILLFVIFHSLTYAESFSKTLLIYGDSISAGYGMPKDKQWSEDLKQIFLDQKLNISIENRSVSGETTGGGLSRLANVLDQTRPDYLLIELGGNDALRGYPPTKILKNLNEMIDLAKNRNIRVFLMQIKILPNYGKRYQEQFESIYLKASNEKKVTLLPFMLDNIALEEGMMLQDGIHPNEKAQPLIAQYVFNDLKPYLNQ